MQSTMGKRFSGQWIRQAKEARLECKGEMRVVMDVKKEKGSGRRGQVIVSLHRGRILIIPAGIVAAWTARWDG